VRETYAAVGIDIELPLFTGGRISARAREAGYKVQAAQKALEETEDDVVRDLNRRWLSLAEARKRISVTDALFESASQAWELAKSRYEGGSASFVELSQAELAKTQAEIEHATARYEYQIDKTALEFQTGSLRFVKPSRLFR
jgi:outer membrane protein